MPRSQPALAAELLALHALPRGRDLLVLPNAWDVASARILAAAGARAIGTTSMGISASLGFPDVECLPLGVMLDCVGRIAHAVDVPVTADMEAGYGATTAEVVRSVGRAVDCGVVGINIEDGTGDPAAPVRDPSVLVDRIRAIREATAASGLHLVINARTDVFLSESRSPDATLRDGVARLRQYRAAGADCVFAPGRLDPETIRHLVAEVDAPLNVLANPALTGVGTPSIPRLRELGVARVSVGSGLMRSSLAFVARAAEELLGPGTYSAMESEVERPGSAESYQAAIGRIDPDPPISDR